MGKSTISMAIFNSYVSLPEGKPSPSHHHIYGLYKPSPVMVGVFYIKGTIDQLDLESASEHCSHRPWLPSTKHQTSI